MELLNFKSPVFILVTKKDWPEAIFPSGFEVLTPELNADSYQHLPADYMLHNHPVYKLLVIAVLCVQRYMVPSKLTLFSIKNKLASRAEG
jgi:hypothetical protein